MMLRNRRGSSGASAGKSKWKSEANAGTGVKETVQEI